MRVMLVRFPKFFAVLGVPFVLFAAAPAHGASFDTAISEDDVHFELKAEGTFRWGGIFRIFDGALFARNGSHPAQVIDGNAPLRLELRYHRRFSREDIVDGGNALLAQNVDASTLEAISERLAKINAAYRDISPGDRYSLTFVPDKGTTLRLNGEPLVTVEGADFADAYFRIWLGENPISASFRDQLLGG